MKLSEDSRKDLEIVDLKIKLIQMQFAELDREMVTLQNTGQQIVKKFCEGNSLDFTKVVKADPTTGEITIKEEKEAKDANTTQ
jgi:hypothetical protein